MNTINIILFIALFSSAALGNRQRRQSDNSQNNEDLEDRYGWNRPQYPPWMNPNPWQRPNYPFPETYPFPYPNPNPNPNPFPNPNPNPNPLPNPNPNPNPLPNPTPSPNPTSPPSTEAPNASSTQSPDVQACIRSCPVTPEYNPVCGSNGNTYDNPGRLTCAQMCGVSVSLLRTSRCPATTPAPPTS